MKLTGEQKLALPRDRVWQALNDPEILKRCVPGCDTFEPDGPNRYNVGMSLAVGPVKARFRGKLTLADIVPPQSYSLTFEGSGGAAGFGKGSANVKLTDIDGGTLLAYDMDAQVGGKLAQVGTRLIDGVSRKIADEFFTRFARAVSTGVDQEAPAAAVSAPASAAVAPAAVASPTRAPAAVTVAPAPAPAAGGSSATIAVLGAAISAVAAAVAVLAAVIAVHGLH
jgi:hypothetical protein